MKNNAIDVLLLAGYRRWNPQKGEYNTDLYTKQIFSPKQKKLFYTIEINRWLFPDWHESFQFDVSFYDADKTMVGMGISYPGEKLDERLLKKVERWYHKMFKVLDFIPDPYNQP